MSKKTPEPVQYGSAWSLLAAVIFAVGAGFLFYAAKDASCTAICPHSNNTNQIIVPGSPIPVDIRSLRIDGTPTPDGENPDLPVAIMVDNHPDARDQYGLNDASVVYETLAEGGFTRYLALYQNATSEVIGPVRSARDYFLPFAAEWNAEIAHAGGSPQALADIQTHNLKNIEEISFIGPDYFWRSARRRAPHNLYTHAEHMADARERLEYEDAINFDNWTPWQFVPTGAFAQTNSAATVTEQIDVEWSFRTSADVSFVYDPVARSYERMLGGEEHLDALTDETITVSTVVLMHVPQERVLDSAGRLALEVTGEGDVDIFSEGVHIAGTWHKESYDTRTLFETNKDEPIIFTPGLVWILIVPDQTEVSF